MNDIAAMATPPSEAERPAARRRAWLGKALHRLALLLPGIAILVFWQWASGRLIKEIYVSKPTAVAERLYELFSSGEIYPHLWTTGQELVLGFVLGVGGGILAGLRSAARRGSPASSNPIHGVLRYSKDRIGPTVHHLVRHRIWSKIALAGIMVFFLVFYNVYSGVRSVDRELVNLTLVMGASQRQLTYHVYLPAAAPYVLLGMRMAVPYSVIGVIVGEFTSSTQGLGLFIHEASSTYDPAGVFAGIVILLAFVVVANILAGRLERRILRWKTPIAHAPSDI